MSVYEKSRWAVFSQHQHPYRHDLSEFFYSNPRLPAGFSSVSDSLDYIMAVLYPNYKATVATPADLPLVATNNDYYFVTDDGDGKSAGYVYTVLDGVSQWIKRYDVDWSLEGILAETVNRTQYMYVHKYGFDDHDALGVPLVGVLAGQQIFGGTLTNTNLTLNANSFDDTGYVQTVNHFRPTTDNLIDLGTGALQFRSLKLGTDATISTLLLATGSITDSTGSISFGNENLSTTGTFASGTITVSTALVLAAGSITDVSGAISFDNENLSTTGTITGDIGYFVTRVEVGPLAGNALLLAPGSITDESGDISFGNENLSTTGTLGAGDTTVTKLTVDNIEINGNTIQVPAALNLNGTLIISANGTGIIDLQSPLQTLGQTVTGTVGITGQLNIDNLRLDGNVLSSTSGNITITSAGIFETSNTFQPAADGTLDLGTIAKRFNDLFIDGSISDGTTSISQATLQSLRNINVGDGPGMANGMTLFWNSVSSTWEASIPNSEITHGNISGLSADDHAQYMLLAGRALGQALIGGTGASETLSLESTAHATKGTIIFKDTLRPGTDASYSGGWQGIDLGSSSFYLKDIYSKGIHYGLRLQNSAGQSFNANNVGRILWNSTTNKALVDIGTELKEVTKSVWKSTVAFVAVTFVDTDVSAKISDARNAIWQVRDDATNKIAYLDVEVTSASNVRITLNESYTGTFTLLGIE
jgi:hypothetical protein